MNAVDIVQLNLFLAELAQAQIIDRDDRAESAIRAMLVHQPDATYLLVQRVLQLESALCGAHASASAPTREAGVTDTDPAPIEERRRCDAWWRQTAAGFAGTAFLLRSSEYLLGDRP
jgi:hypothetical protein